MTTSSMRPRTFVGTGAVALSAVLLATGCAPGEDGAGLQAGTDAVVDGGGSAPGSTDPEGPDAEEPDSEEPAPEPSNDETPEPAPEPGTGADCLPGNWFLDTDGFAALLADASGGTVEHVQGGVMLSLRADGSATTHYDDWSYTVTMDEGALTLLRQGADEATYEVTADGAMTMTETSTGSTATATMTSDGQTFTLEAPPQEPVLTRATFTCSGDELTVTAEGATTTMYREH